jgi:hypothetical protein
VLPFGPDRALLPGATGVLARLVENWQLGGILQWMSGVPLTLTTNTATLTFDRGAATPDIVGDFPKSTGKVTRIAKGVTYFHGLRQITDPAGAGVATLQGTQARYNRFAIADSGGNLLLVNPAPGTLGNMGRDWVEGPSFLKLDMNLVKRVRIDETKELELRVDAINILNRPSFGNPNVDINSPDFGLITSASGARQFVLNARLNF